MKKFIIIQLLLTFTTVSFSQNSDVVSQLNQKYDKVYSLMRSAVGRGYQTIGYIVNKGGKTGYCDWNGKEIVKPIYNSLEPKDNGFYFETTEKKGMLSRDGKVIIEFNRKDYTSIVCDFPYMKREIWGFCLKTTNETIYCDVSGESIKWIRPKTQYGEIKSAFAGYTSHPTKPYGYYVKNLRNINKGYLDAEGEEVIAPNKYASIEWDPHVDLFITGDHNGVLSNNGTVIIKPGKYSEVRVNYKEGDLSSYNGFIVKKDELYGYCDKTGTLVIKPKYKNRIYKYEYDSHVVYKTSDDKGSCLLDEKGKYIIEGGKYALVDVPNEGLVKVKDSNNKFGFVSIVDGSVVIPLEYDEAWNFKDGSAKVEKNGETFLIPNPLLAVASNNQPKVKGKAVSTYPAPDSDVDKNIPKGKKADSNTHAFIIANENYPVAKVPYALNDGWMFEQYCKKTLGIKEENVHLYEDATGGNIMACVEEMKQTTQAANGQATIIFYYAGHAFPDEEKSTAYLLPIDGDSKNPSTGYSLENLYKEMNKVQVKQMVCFLDACFSGATRDDQMLITGRGVTIKVKDEIPQGNMVVMTSATGAETAHSYEEMHHGLFTYFLLQKLQETKGDVTLGDLSEYVTKMVKRKSVLINQKKQTPTVIPSPKLQGTWQGMKL